MLRTKKRFYPTASRLERLCSYLTDQSINETRWKPRRRRRTAVRRSNIIARSHEDGKYTRRSTGFAYPKRLAIPVTGRGRHSPPKLLLYCCYESIGRFKRLTIADDCLPRANRRSHYSNCDDIFVAAITSASHRIVRVCVFETLQRFVPFAHTIVMEHRPRPRAVVRRFVLIIDKHI